MKLFVWEDCFHDYTAGLAVVVAPDRGTAIDLMVEKLGYTHADLSKTPQEWELDKINHPLVFFVAGGS